MVCRNDLSTPIMASSPFLHAFPVRTLTGIRSTTISRGTKEGSRGKHFSNDMANVGPQCGRNALDQVIVLCFRRTKEIDFWRSKKDVTFSTFTKPSWFGQYSSRRVNVRNRDHGTRQGCITGTSRRRNRGSSCKQ